MERGGEADEPKPHDTDVTSGLGLRLSPVRAPGQRGDRRSLEAAGCDCGAGQVGSSLPVQTTLTAVSCHRGDGSPVELSMVLSLPALTRVLAQWGGGGTLRRPPLWFSRSCPNGHFPCWPTSGLLPRLPHDPDSWCPHLWDSLGAFNSFNWEKGQRGLCPAANRPNP